MNRNLKALYDFLQESSQLADDEKAALLKSVKDVDKELEMALFKLDRTEKVKKTTAILLEETIAELEQKRKSVEIQNRELEIEGALERVRSVAMGMKQPADMLVVCHMISDQLQLLQVPNIRNIQTAIIDEGKGTYINYQYFTPYQQAAIEEVEYNKHPKVLELVLQLQKSADAFFSGNFVGKELEVWRQFRKDENQFPDPILEEATAVYYYFYSIGEGGLGISTYTPLMEEDILVFKRFRNVFDLAYRRFMDIQQAEAQAREAQIEASLERVRAKAMAMHKSEDLNMAVATVFEELDKLDLGMARCGISILDKEKRSADVFTTSISDQGKIVNVSGDESIDIHPLLQGAFDAWVKQSDFSYVLEGKDLDRYYQAVGETNIRLPDSQIILSQAEEIRQYFYVATFQAGCLFAFRDASFSEEAKKVMKHFADVFNLTYTRFLDLQKAEAQAREAKIEVAVERVRAKALAMHKSEDLHSVVVTLKKELMGLRIPDITAATMYLAQNDGSIRVLDLSDTGGEDDDKPQLQLDKIFRLEETDPDLWIRRMWNRTENYFVLEADEADFVRVVQWLRTVDPASAIMAEKIISEKSIKKAWLPTVKLEKGIMNIDLLAPPSDEIKYILLKMGAGFDLAYKRFLDLQKAEAQARESQIEAALERVRGKAMSMQTSNDLSATASTVFVELRKLGIHSIRSGVGLLTNESRKVILYAATSSEEGDNLSLVGWAILQDHPVLSEIYDSWTRHEDYFPILKGELLQTYYEKILSSFSVPGSHYKQNLPDNALTDSNSDYEQHGHFLAFSEGFLYGWSEKPYTESEIKILNRFKLIIDLTFRRYIELQKSETNTRDAVRQASLDRVRAEIASMRTTADLERITPLMWNELTTLGVPFIRCGVFIMDDETQIMHTYLSTREGKDIAAMHLPYSGIPLTEQAVAHWRNQSIYTEHWDNKDFQNWTRQLIELGHIRSAENYQAGSVPEHLHLHFIPFTQGMLYVGSTDPLSDDNLDLIRSLAAAFATAYARYEDFNQLEKAKQGIESALTDLKAAQAQLIQSEKMASLGELTAGIAHEIQNPLNFVNNFSEVNAELIDELNNELAIGNMQSAKEIGESIKDNEEKILFHGKRADAIVKGMLMHSRSSSSVKEPTDINALADEYLRLAYHGLRAKDKSFNASMKTDFDPNIGLINIIPQDIGRVILNLITNAFYAVSHPLPPKGGPEYEPTVSVKTIKHFPLSGGRGSEVGLGAKVEISVKDNGSGIPPKSMDKIFQPFFTTKPVGQGTGLGLSISYDIIKAHGGELTVQTKEGEGTEFIIQLPVQ